MTPGIVLPEVSFELVCTVLVMLAFTNGTLSVPRACVLVPNVGVLDVAAVELVFKLEKEDTPLGVPEGVDLDPLLDISKSVQQEVVLSIGLFV